MNYESKGHKKSTEPKCWALKIIWWQNYGRDSTAEFLKLREWGSHTRAEMACTQRADTGAELFKCHEKKGLCAGDTSAPTCLQVQLLAILASLLLANVRLHLNRKEVRSIVGVLIFTCGFFSLCFWKPAETKTWWSQVENGILQT